MPGVHKIYNFLDGDGSPGDWRMTINYLRPHGKLQLVLNFVILPLKENTKFAWQPPYNASGQLIYFF